MSVLSDLLGVEHFTTARGSTVWKDFLVAVAGALGIEGPEDYGKDPMPWDLYFSWGNHKNDALLTIIDGVHSVVGTG